MGLLLSGLILALGLYIVSVYNKFQTTKTRIQAAVQEIGNQLKRQAELIPNLVESVKGYMAHEQKALDKITEARKMVLSAVKAGDAQKMVDAAAAVQQALAPIRAVFESTPELKAVEATTKLMNELRDTADKVMYARRTLIDLTADYNAMIVTFPSNLVAKLFHFQRQPGLKVPEEGAHLEVSEKETQAPKVKF